jgi:ribosome biogenesis GTPase
VRLKTNSVREKDGKGRHITTSRQLIKLKNGAMLIDTPGMRELGNFAVDTGIHSTTAQFPIDKFQRIVYAAT